MEGADEVLALGQVDRDLSAYGGVHHGEQTGGHLDHRHAPKVSCCDEAGEVSDHAAPYRHHEMTPLRLSVRQPAVDECGRLQRLAPFPGRHLEHVRSDAGRLQGHLGAPGVSMHALVRDDVGRRGAQHLACPLPQLLDCAPAHPDPL